MTPMETHSDDAPYLLPRHAVDELANVTQAVDRLEVQLCLLWLRLEYGDSSHSTHARALAKQVGDIHQRLEDIQTLGF